MQGVRMLETGMVRKKPAGPRSEYYLSTAINICKISSLEQQLLEILPTPVYTCDPDGIITYFNEAAAQAWGRRPEAGVEVLCGAWKVYSPTGALLDTENHPLAIAMREKKETPGQEIIIEREDGSRRNILCHPKLFFDEAGNFTGVLNILTDITGWLEADKARHGTGMDDNFLASMPFNLRGLLEEVMVLFTAKVREKKISLELDYDSRLHHNFIGDPHRLKQIMVKLVDNAVKFTSRGGVKIIVGHTGASNYLSEISIHVVDSGIGIAESRKQAIFHSSGSSNLNKSLTLARLMGGEISVESREHYGSEFTLVLPLVADVNPAPTENHLLSET